VCLRRTAFNSPFQHDRGHLLETVQTPCALGSGLLPLVGSCVLWVWNLNSDCNVINCRCPLYL
jgi:hypothetical protein